MRSQRIRYKGRKTPDKKLLPKHNKNYPLYRLKIFSSCTVERIAGLHHFARLEPAAPKDAAAAVDGYKVLQVFHL